MIRRSSFATVIPCIVAVLALPPLPAQMPNSPYASAVWGGWSIPPWPTNFPINVSLFGATSVTYVVSGLPNQPYALIWAPAGLDKSAFGTPMGGVDLNLSGGFFFLMDGIAGTGPFDAFAKTGANGTSTWTFPIPPGATDVLGGFQTLVQNPPAPSGFTLTAATGITLGPLRIYVSSTTGTGENPGTALEPYNHIAYAFAHWQAHGPTVPLELYIAAGTYNESLMFTNFATNPNITVVGGLSPTTWTPVPGVRSIMNGGAMTAQLVNGVFSVTAMQFNASNNSAPGGNSIAVFVNNASGSFTDCGFTTGNAGNGGPGANGAQGTAGASGGPGVHGGIGPGPAAGGPGGNTPGGIVNPGAPGGAGTNGAGIAGIASGLAAGGAGGAAATSVCGTGGPGQPGSPGSPPPNTANNGIGGADGFANTNGVLPTTGAAGSRVCKDSEAGAEVAVAADRVVPPASASRPSAAVVEAEARVEQAASVVSADRAADRRSAS